MSVTLEYDDILLIFFYFICIVTCDNDCRIWLGITGPSLSQEQEKSCGNSEMATVLFKDRVDRVYCTKTSQCGDLQWKHCEFALNVVSLFNSSTL